MDKIEFRPGDQYAYFSVTQGYLVVWTRREDVGRR